MRHDAAPAHLRRARRAARQRERNDALLRLAVHRARSRPLCAAFARRYCAVLVDDNDVDWIGRGFVDVVAAASDASRTATTAGLDDSCQHVGFGVDVDVRRRHNAQRQARGDGDERDDADEATRQGESHTIDDDDVDDDNDNDDNDDDNDADLDADERSRKRFDVDVDACVCAALYAARAAAAAARAAARLSVSIAAATTSHDRRRPLSGEAPKCANKRLF